MQVTGVLIIIVSIFICVKVRKNKFLLFLTVILALINISLAYTDCICLGVNVASWQSVGLRSKEINPIVAKSILLTLAIINLFFDENMIEQCEMQPKVTRKRNSINAFGGMVILYAILAIGILSMRNRTGGYESVSSPIFEYSFIVYFFVWWYSSGMMLVDFGLWIYTVVFSLVFLGIGDRSSVVMLWVLTYCCYFYDKLRVRTLIAGIGIGIPFMNIISAIRTGPSLSLQGIVERIIERGFYIDTVSYAYYASLAIASLHNKVENSLDIVVGFFSGCLGFDNEFYSLSKYARDHYTDLYNVDGGIYPSFFYAMGGYLGVVIGAVILGFIIRRILLGNGNNSTPYKVLLVTYCFRWYLYNPSTLFRGVLIFISIIWVICEFLDQLSQRNRCL